MFELFCKISFFLFMLVMYAYVTSTSVVAIIIFGYILCVFSYYYFQTIKTAIDELLNYVQNHGIPKTNLNSSQVPNYAANKKYNKVNNAVNVPTMNPMNNKIYIPIYRNKNLFASNTPAAFTCKFKNFVLNGDLSSPLMRNGLSVKNGHKSRDELKLPMHNMNKGFNNSSALRFRSNSQSGLNPFASCKRYSNNMDMETYMNVKSPGFTSRIVDKAMESASYHIKYPAVKQISAYRFDKSTLRHFSKIPRMNSTPVVRIAPPEPISIHLLNDIEKKLVDKNEAKDQNSLHTVKDSRKRNYSQDGGNEKSNGTAKKSRKNDIKNFTISQYKRSLEDKSRDILEDNSKRRCDDYNRDAPKMVVYAPTLAMASNSCPNTYSKKRKSSKTDKSKNECAESIEKYRRIDNSSKDIAMKEYSNEAKPKNCDLKPHDPPSVKDSKSDEVSDQRSKHALDESVDDESGEYVRVASGKILNRTNRLYRRKLNSNKIDPVSVIASEPEIVGKITGTDDVAMKEHLLQNLLSRIESKGHKDEKVIFYENSIIEEVSKQNSLYDEPPQQVPNPIFTDDIMPNVDEVEMNDVINDGLGQSVINFAYLPNNKSASCIAIHHSTPIISNVNSRRSYSGNSNEPANHVSSKVFGSPITGVDNCPNFADSGYDSLSREISVRNSTSFNQSFSFTQEPTFALSNGFDSKIPQLPITSNSETNLNAHFGNASVSSFGSGDGKFFNPGNIVFNSSINSKSASQTGTNGGNYNFGAPALNGKTSIRFEPSFSSIASNSPETFSMFGNGNSGSLANANFSIGAGDNPKNHAARIERNRSNH